MGKPAVRSSHFGYAVVAIGWAATVVGDIEAIARATWASGDGRVADYLHLVAMTAVFLLGAWLWARQDQLIEAGRELENRGTLHSDFHESALTQKHGRLQDRVVKLEEEAQAAIGHMKSQIKGIESAQKVTSSAASDRIESERMDHDFLYQLVHLAACAVKWAHEYREMQFEILGKAGQHTRDELLAVVRAGMAVDGAVAGVERVASDALARLGRRSVLRQSDETKIPNSLQELVAAYWAPPRSGTDTAKSHPPEARDITLHGKDTGGDLGGDLPPETGPLRPPAAPPGPRVG